MSSLKHIFQNNMMKAVFIGMVVLSLICTSVVKQMLEKVELEDRTLNQYEWILPLGTYDSIQAAEFEDTVYFLADTGKEPGQKYVMYKWDGKTLKNSENWHVFLTSNVYSKLYRDVHPAGYWICSNSDDNGMEYVTDLDRNRLTSYYSKDALKLTEMPGYAIDAVNRTVITLGNENVIYTAPENESIYSQAGDYWVMKREIPREGKAPLDLLYLRNMDFSLALDGMLFTRIWEIEAGDICGDAVTNVRYDNLPVTLIYAEERLVRADGTWTAISLDTGKRRISSADDGYYVTEVRTTERKTIHFFDGTESANIESQAEPFGPCRDGIIAFRDKDDYTKKGFMNSNGEIIVEPLFSEYSTPQKGTAVVVSNGLYGVIRLKGGEEDA